MQSATLKQDFGARPEFMDDTIFDPETRRELSGPGLRSFVTLANLWGLTEEQRRRILGSPARSTYQNWIKKVQEHREITLDYDVLIRISAVLGIYQALRILESTEQAGLSWLRTPHKARVFGGRPPLDLITSGSQDALLTARRFLDAARGGLYMGPNEVDRNFKPYTDQDIVFSD